MNICIFVTVRLVFILYTLCPGDTLRRVHNLSGNWRILFILSGSFWNDCTRSKRLLRPGFSKGPPMVPFLWKWCPRSCSPLLFRWTKLNRREFLLKEQLQKPKRKKSLNHQAELRAKHRSRLRMELVSFSCRKQASKWDEITSVSVVWITSAQHLSFIDHSHLNIAPNLSSVHFIP